MSRAPLSFRSVVPRSLLSVALVALVPSMGGAQEERLGPEERDLLDFMRRRGEIEELFDELDGFEEDFPGDPALQVLRARALLDLGEHAEALEVAAGALESALVLEPEEGRTADAARVVAAVELELGRPSDAQVTLERASSHLAPRDDPRDAWLSGRVRLELGQREAAHEFFRSGAETPTERLWPQLLAQAQCQRALGKIESSAATLVAADKLAASGLGTEPDILVALGELYFEAYGEVDDPVSKAHSPAELYREALSLNPEHEGALIGLYELYRFNWVRSRTSPRELLQKIFTARPDSIRGLLAQADFALDNGNLRQARESLSKLERSAPGRRDVRTERAALLWIEHRREEAREILEGLNQVDPADSMPDLRVGRHLLELYRFAEGLPFLEAAVERNPRDFEAWTELGRAQANTGDEESARASLAKSEQLAEGRHNAWRKNTQLILKRMAGSLIEHDTEGLKFLWQPDVAFVLETYLEPFYRNAREELAQRYGFTPGPVKIEVFRDWTDFSVRSTGFEGYPALGVCFGPVVTAVSPLSVLRGQFSWARTSFHEFTHVIHLGLSHNRCPRWVTEGLATWEEGNRNPSWWRNLRRELIDARANDTITPIRRLNNAFRGQGVIFAYYQSGLLCKMLIEEHGFGPMVRILRAFDAGADLDKAFEDVLEKSPEELDQAFLAYVDETIAPLAIEPRWSPANTFRRRFKLARKPPEGATERARWSDEWCKVAWGFYWQREILDAEEALRRAETAGELSPRGHFLRGELRIAKNEVEEAREAFRLGFDAGGEDYRARMALGVLLMREAAALGSNEKGSEARLDEAELHLLAAQEAFPGYDQPAFSAELRLAELYELRGDEDAANEARIRWLAFNAGNYDVRVEVAEWLDESGRFEESERFWNEANEVDPFRRHLHYRWGLALRALGRDEEAAREFEVGLRVPEELDLDVVMAGGDSPVLLGNPHGPVDEAEKLLAEDLPDPLENANRASRWQTEAPLLWGELALTLQDLGRLEESRNAIEEALQLDPGCRPALEAQGRLP